MAAGGRGWVCLQLYLVGMKCSPWTSRDGECEALTPGGLLQSRLRGVPRRGPHSTPATSPLRRAFHTVKSVSKGRLQNRHSVGPMNN